MRTSTAWAAAVALGALWPAIALAADDAAQVAGGALKGVVADGVASFKGVPYAAPPVGPLRWRPPQHVQPWSGVRDTSVYGPGCVSMRFGNQKNQKPPPQSEDCLTLNIWTPAAPTKRPLPVMVWIHGGGFAGGTGANPMSDGARFARRGVVLVTLNYRLSRLGFFAHPAIAASNPKGEPLGNYGLMDQIAALTWVRDNIAAFGGDPANVTIFGCSAGGQSVNDLMVSPMARGLFAKAISQSGFARTPTPPIADVERANERYLARAGVRDADPAALRALPADTIQNSPFALDETADLPMPMLDGQVMTENPVTAFAAGRQARVPYVAGGTSWEASLYAAIPGNADLTLKALGPAKPRALSLYGADAKAAAQDITTEAGVAEPNRLMARGVARSGQRAYLYRFSFVTPPMRGSVHGQRHGGEQAYVFGNLPPDATSEDRAISDAVMAYWVQFAKTGDPGAAGGPPWPRYAAGREQQMEFSDAGPAARPVPTARLDFVEATRVGCMIGLWDKAEAACRQAVATAAAMKAAR